MHKQKRGICENNLVEKRSVLRDVETADREKKNGRISKLKTQN